MKQYKNILYVAEETADHTSTFAGAVLLAETNRAELKVIDVVPLVPGENKAVAIASRMKTLESMVAPYQHRLRMQLEVVTGTVFLEVIRAVLRNGHDLVIKPAESQNFFKRLFGSNDMHLLRKCPCPLWLMKPQEKPVYKCIMAAVDFDPLQEKMTEQDELNERILALSSSLALLNGASLHVVHAWVAFAERTMRARGGSAGNTIGIYLEKEYISRQKLLMGLGETLRKTIGADAYHSLSVHFHLPKGSAQKMIPEVAVKLGADIVVMGTVARTGISGFIIGNTAETILNQLECSVLAIKPAGFITPVTVTD